MPIGIPNATRNMTIQNLTDIADISDPMGWFINVNHQVYGGVLFFILLWVLWVILFMVFRETDALKGRPLVNIMYGGAVVSVLSFIMRVINISRSGVIEGLLTDNQMWVFPIITIFLAAAIWAINRS